MEKKERYPQSDGKRRENLKEGKPFDGGQRKREEIENAEILGKQQ